ncbi:hypothetical protein C4G95_RS20985 [Vibrio parahaemolyticus]|nr:hypothetical protein [Vibrio parahaemolyticus]EJE8675911.1 hypothetical protein [Vibrio parahaemolyticus]EJG0961478.1 hypothetical protein [Vibrio parahaemolyticus]EJG1861783.1 hypothetical protein [Vibrio parahaemolyticus]
MDSPAHVGREAQAVWVVWMNTRSQGSPVAVKVMVSFFMPKKMPVETG